MHQGRITHKGFAHEVRMGRTPRHYVTPEQDELDALDQFDSAFALDNLSEHHVLR